MQVLKRITGEDGLLFKRKYKVMNKTWINAWTWMRSLRGIMGVMAFVQGILTKDWLLGMGGAFLLFMAIFNVGCCGVYGCSVAPPASGLSEKKEIIYEEVDHP